MRLVFLLIKILLPVEKKFRLKKNHLSCKSRTSELSYEILFWLLAHTMVKWPGAVSCIFILWPISVRAANSDPPRNDKIDKMRFVSWNNYEITDWPNMWTKKKVEFVTQILPISYKSIKCSFRESAFTWQNDVKMPLLVEKFISHITKTKHMRMFFSLSLKAVTTLKSEVFLFFSHQLGNCWVKISECVFLHTHIHSLK